MVAIIVVFIVTWIIASSICGGNLAIGFFIALGVFAIVVVADLQKEEEQKTKLASQNKELEDSVYQGLRDDWNKHKDMGNHFVPAEYVGYFEKNEDGWRTWAKARTNEIMIAKGYMPMSFSCLSKYDKVLKKREDYSTHEALYKNFNYAYLPLIEYYNKTGEVVYRIADLPTEKERKEQQANKILSEFRINK